jgi:SAM-dependent methyltransferase
LDRFFGRIAEVGPGDSSGVALLMLADGAEQIDLVDRFYSRRDLAYHKAVYDRLKHEVPVLQTLLPPDFDGEGCPALARRYGADASSERFFRGRSGYDFIVSRAVMEHVLDPVGSLEHMVAALKPGALMLHAVDLRDHGMFTGRGFPELTFLGIPPWFYRQMTQATGRPNRVPLSRYRQALPSAQFKVTSLVGQGQLDRPTPYEDIAEPVRQRALEAVRAQRSLLHPVFQTETDEDLSVSGFFLIFRKPGSAAP